VMLDPKPAYYWRIRGVNPERVRKIRIAAQMEGISEGELVDEILNTYLEAHDIPDRVPTIIDPAP
jgi:hypothetical protein